MLLWLLSFEVRLPKTVSDVVGCEGCPMRELFPANTFVEPTVPRVSTRLVVAEAPGQEEAIEGHPLVGGAGRVFDGLLSKAGINRAGLSIINTIQCRPPNNDYPTSTDAEAYISPQMGHSAVLQCYNNHVRPVLGERTWKRVDVLGNYALTAITGESGITANRGYIHGVKDYPELGEIVVPTIHPAALMRDQLMTPVVISDLKKSLNQPPENYNTHPSLADVRAFTSKVVCLDIETKGWSEEIDMVGVTDGVYRAMTIPFRGPYIPEIKRILLDAEEIIGHNIVSFDLPILCKALGIEWP